MNAIKKILTHKIPVWQWVLAGVLATLIVGCGSIYTKTPVVDTTTGATNYSFTISPGTSNTLATAQNLVNMIPNNTGIAPVDLGKDAALALLGLASTVLGFVAKIKSNTAAANAATAATHQQAADLLAATVVKNNLSAQALIMAANSPVVGTIAQHLDNNTA